MKKYLLSVSALVLACPAFAQATVDIYLASQIRADAITVIATMWPATTATFAAARSAAARKAYILAMMADLFILRSNNALASSAASVVLYAPLRTR